MIIAPIQLHISGNDSIVTRTINQVFTDMKPSSKIVLKLDNFQFMNLIPNIPQNMTLNILEVKSNTNRNITIEKGYYSAGDLAQTVQNKLNSFNGLVYNINFNDIFQKFEFKANENIQLIYNNSTIASYLGFTSNSISSSSFLSDESVDLSVTDFIFMYCNLVNSNLIDQNIQQVLVKIPLNQPTGSMVFYEGKDDDWVIIKSRYDNMEIKLYDRFLNLIDTQNKLWSASFKFYEL